MGAEIKGLEVFVREALRSGASRNEITKVLHEAGWSTAQTTSVLQAYADVPFVVPVPRPRASLSAREAFLYLVMFSTLYYSAFNLGDLLFTFINQAFADPAANYYMRNFADAVRWPTSALIIGFPLFLFTARYIGGEVTQNPIKRLSGVRRWLTYITLFIATTLLIGDTTSLVYHLLGGEITIRFMLKSLVVGVIAGTIFGYYLWDLRSEEKEL